MITFRRAVREAIPLIIAVSGGTGSGKTLSAMRMAKGICGSKPFCVIDTENGRASHYADQFTFDVLDLRAPFSPDAYTKAIQAADKAAYPVIVVDSMSHVWAGDGGVLDWQEAELERMAGQDFQRREACKMAAWIKPKMAHKDMMQALLQVKAHVILCFRAEEKIEMVKQNGRMEVRKKESLIGKDGWVPICEKSVPFEATCSFLLLASNPGIPHPIKLQEQHKPFVSLTAHLDESAGAKLAEWAKGGNKPEPQAAGTSHDVPATPQASDRAPAPSDDAPAFIWRVGKKHAGESIRTIPDDYLTWFAENGKNPDHVQAANDEIDRRMGQASADYADGEDVA